MTDTRVLLTGGHKSDLTKRTSTPPTNQFRLREHAPTRCYKVQALMSCRVCRHWGYSQESKRHDEIAQEDGIRPVRPNRALQVELPARQLDRSRIQRMDGYHDSGCVGRFAADSWEMAPST